MRSFKKRQIINLFKNVYHYLRYELMQWLASKGKLINHWSRRSKTVTKCVQLIGVNVRSQENMAQ
jgi:hypothetical protein